MTPLLDRCHARDVRLWAEGDRLRYDAPRGAIDADLRAELVAHKDELVVFLSAQAAAAAEVVRPSPPPAIRQSDADPLPPIVIDCPDRDRMLAALHATIADPDRYAIAERLAIQSEDADPHDNLVGPPSPLADATVPEEEDFTYRALELLVGMLTSRSTEVGRALEIAADQGIAPHFVHQAVALLKVKRSVVDGQDVWSLKRRKV